VKEVYRNKIKWGTYVFTGVSVSEKKHCCPAIRVHIGVEKAYENKT